MKLTFDRARRWIRRKTFSPFVRKNCSFPTAMKALYRGCYIRRKGWEKKVCVGVLMEPGFCWNGIGNDSDGDFWREKFLFMVDDMEAKDWIIEG